MNEKTPMDMFEELTKLGLITPAVVDPVASIEGVEFVDIPTTLAYTTPPVPLWNEGMRGGSNAELGRRTKRNKQDKKRSRNR